MTWTQWLVFIIIIQILHGLGTWKLYIEAGRQAWEAFAPVYNAVVLMKIINRPWYWTVLLFLPIVNLIMFPVIWVETARSFGKNAATDTVLAIVSLGFYNYYLNYVAPVDYIAERSLKPRTAFGDWVSSILFAVVAATIVHTYFIQPYTIPTSSLEKSLLVGDFLFVSKFHYGARVPMTTVAAPMVHDTIPGLKSKSYLYDDNAGDKGNSWKNTFQLPYLRLPGFQKIKHNDIVVFNWPVDTLYNMYKPADRTYYKPVDKRTNYVKRCVGLPGDSLQIKDGFVYVNGKQNVLPDRAKLQFFHTVETKPDISMPFLNQYGITEFTNVFSLPTNVWDDARVQDYLDNNNTHLNVVYKDSSTVHLVGQMSRKAYEKLQFQTVSNKISANATLELAAKMKQDPQVVSIVKNSSKKRDYSVFPHDANYNWNNDFFGPLYIPEAGATVALNLETLPLYKRIITDYEGHTLQVKGNQIFIDGAVAKDYTFKKDYYWLMGDNRHNSLDARSWGFVPFDHVVGKPVFIWMSWGDGKPRWERWFTTVGGSGKPVSYLIPFLVLLGLWFGFNQWRKRKKAA
ncbi:signal peptidase I [Mangrovimonas yunxiaonensis]|uniref:Signal peptidase I n=1 Tax=Mangrovimonas yunxiaonensis TaxID=1197477 RepID=A0A084TNM8_9FLAO|nr:signal peptidase I [Mangrovimonas yunxiaonensis]KFB02314.1 signal peptidase I [Mangrovimonas yunxiaonensis]GGH39601.1 signal peptidase I [Mangrovimonas yunxiaonensis]